MNKDYYIQNCQCIHCKKHIYKTSHPTNSYGNIYSIEGLQEYMQSGLCEYCFDNLTKDKDKE